jgi:hypothetical protein
MVLKVKMLDVNGRLLEIRIRSNRRIAVREADLPTPPPKTVTLRCMGEQLEMRLVIQQFGYAVYYMPADAFRRLAELAGRYETLPCVFTF